MILAAAQISCEVGQVQQNVDQHLKFIQLAAQQGVQLIIFPEMSLTGYCRKEGRTYAFSQNDPRLIPFKEAAQSHEIRIVVGAPILIDDKLHIGSFVIQPYGKTKIYTKQFLHDGEEVYYTASMTNNPQLELENSKFSLAICADINNSNHPKNACEINSDFYLASIFFSHSGIAKGHELLTTYSKKYSLNILMSNFSGNHWNMKAGGKSAFWDKSGKLIAELPTKNQGLLIVESKNDSWKYKVIIQN